MNAPVSASTVDTSYDAIIAPIFTSPDAMFLQTIYWPLHVAANYSGDIALDAFVETTQQNLTGAVTLSIYKGNVSIVSRKSDYSLYRTDLSSFTMGASYDQKDAEGFIRILGLPSRCRAQTRTKVEVAQ